MPGVSAGALVQAARSLGRQPGVAVGGRQAQQILGRQALQRQMQPLLTVEDLPPRLGQPGTDGLELQLRIVAVPPVGEDQQDRVVTQAPGRILQRGHRRPVGPLRVVDQ